MTTHPNVIAQIAGSTDAFSPRRFFAFAETTCALWW
jgi:hypothetical protein